MKTLAFANVPPGIFNGGVSVDVAKETETEAAVIGGVCEAVDGDAVVSSLVELAHPVVELVVYYRAPVSGLLVAYWLYFLDKHVGTDNSECNT